MDISYYYHILGNGIVFAKGRQEGRRWKFNEQNRLNSEIVLWNGIIRHIEAELKGEDNAEEFFEELRAVTYKYQLPYYLKICNMKEDLMIAYPSTECRKEDMDKINKLLLDLLSDLSLAVNDKGGKDQAYRILNVMHNLPKAFYGKDILGGTGRISVQEAVEYASMSMTPEMKEKYIDSTFKRDI
jgi:CDP-glycerol glycerophosphotransferase (TagB/SpsB family)